jgi:hypothetical protein
MPEEPNAFLIGGVLLRTLEEVNYSCYLPVNCRKLKINEELYVVSSKIRRIAPEHFHSPVLPCGAARQKRSTLRCAAETLPLIGMFKSGPNCQFLTAH